MPDFLATAGVASIAAAVAALAYAIAFVVQRNRRLYSASLTAQGVLALAVFAGLDDRLAAGGQPGWLTLALLLGALGAYGTATHGAYDLALAVRAAPAAPGDLPSEADPRGFSAFGLSGLAILLFSWAILARSVLPAGLGLLGLVSGVLLIELWLARMILLDPAHPLIRYPVVAQGVIVGPLWLFWVGIALINH